MRFSGVKCAPARQAALRIGDVAEGQRANWQRSGAVGGDGGPGERRPPGEVDGKRRARTDARGPPAEEVRDVVAARDVDDHVAGAKKKKPETAGVMHSAALAAGRFPIGGADARAMVVRGG